jgi:hypothetical protein
MRRLKDMYVWENKKIEFLEAYVLATKVGGCRSAWGTGK